MPLQKATPILRMFDEEHARLFCVYCLQFEHRFGPDISLYLGLVKDGVELHLSEHYGDTTLGTRVRIAVTDIHGFYKDLMSRPFKNLTPGPPQEQSWGVMGPDPD